EIVRSCYAAGLTNSKEDVVKIIFYPTYLKANDGLLNLPYYDVISGMDVGIFPSRYEPFGYTPVEAGLKLNIAITSDTTGFGRFISGKIKGESGVKVLKMFGVEKEKTTDELAQVLEKIYNLDAKELQKMQSDAYNTVKLCDWKELIPNYYKAYEMARKAR
ncbi:glycosyl transferase, partial [Candidatus Micrarchaeota archaeon CG11_big_fil_rev_8_21_14_0_20_47_5]